MAIFEIPLTVQEGQTILLSDLSNQIAAYTAPTYDSISITSLTTQDGTATRDTPTHSGDYILNGISHDITIIDDHISEPDETFYIDASVSGHWSIMGFSGNTAFSVRFDVTIAGDTGPPPPPPPPPLPLPSGWTIDGSRYSTAINDFVHGYLGTLEDRATEALHDIQTYVLDAAANKLGLTTLLSQVKQAQEFDGFLTPYVTNLAKVVFQAANGATNGTIDAHGLDDAVTHAAIASQQWRD